MTVLNNELHVEDNGDVRLRQTYDIGQAMEMAQEVTKSGGGRMGTGSSTWIVKGYIPMEEWNWDINLIAAKEARSEGDDSAYQKYMNKYFEAHPRFRVWTPPKYYFGSSSKKAEETPTENTAEFEKAKEALSQQQETTENDSVQRD